MAEARTKYSNRIQYNMLNTIHIHTYVHQQSKRIIINVKKSFYYYLKKKTFK